MLYVSYTSNKTKKQTNKLPGSMNTAKSSLTCLVLMDFVSKASQSHVVLQKLTCFLYIYLLSGLQLVGKL